MQDLVDAAQERREVRIKIAVGVADHANFHRNLGEGRR
jgi:hypothetical protein